MTNLLEEIRSINKDAARALERAGCCADSDITSLSRTDLNELLPGAEKLQVRKKVFEKIQNTTKTPIDDILKELKSFIPDELLRAALTGDGALVGYLNILKEVKGHVNQIQTFIDAHISLLEGLQKNEDQEPTTGASSRRVSQTFSTGYPQQTHETDIPDKTPPTWMYNSTTSNNVQICTLATVMNKVVITGKTLGAHHDVLEQVRKDFVQGQDSFRLHLVDNSDAAHCRVIIVFCPVVSRLESDVESAMGQVPGDKDIILVLMHHTREAKTSLSLRSWSRPKHVVLDVNVFFHDAVGGLLNCKPNDDAVSEIQRTLLRYRSHTEQIQISQNGSFTSTVRNLYNRWLPNLADK